MTKIMSFQEIKYQSFIGEIIFYHKPKALIFASFKYKLVAVYSLICCVRRNSIQLLA
jgi:hypothetical protein